MGMDVLFFPTLVILDKFYENENRIKNDFGKNPISLLSVISIHK